MSDDITYNQIIFLTNDSFTCQTVKKSFIEKGKLILVLEDLQKIIIAGGNIDTSENKKRILKMVSMAEEKGINIPKKSVKHYAKDEENEYVLVRW